MSTLNEAYQDGIRGFRKHEICSLGPLTLYSTLTIKPKNKNNHYGATVEYGFCVNCRGYEPDTPKVFDTVFSYPFSDYESAMNCFHALGRIYEEAMEHGS